MEPVTVNENLVSPIPFKFNDLLNAYGVKPECEDISFKPVDFNLDGRINKILGNPGFIPVLNNCSRGRHFGGGEALQFEGGETDVEKNIHSTVNNSEVKVPGDAWGEVVRVAGGSGADVGGEIRDVRTVDTEFIKFPVNNEQIIDVLIADRKIPMLFDTGTQLSILHPDFLPADFVNNLKSVNSIQLLGAFGLPAAGFTVDIEVALVSNPRSVRTLRVALCNQLNGNMGLLSMSDYELLNDSMIIPTVKVINNSGLLYTYDCKKADIAELHDRALLSSIDISNAVNGGKNDMSNIFKLDLSSESYQSFKQEQLDDSTLIPSWNKAAEENSDFMINSENALLYHKQDFAGTEIFQLVIPEVKRKTIIEAAHNNSWSFHFGAVKTIKRIKAYFFGMG